MLWKVEGGQIKSLKSVKTSTIFSVQIRILNKATNSNGAELQKEDSFVHRISLDSSTVFQITLNIYQKVPNHSKIHISRQYYEERHWAVWKKKQLCKVNATDPRSAGIWVLWGFLEMWQIHNFYLLSFPGTRRYLKFWECIKQYTAVCLRKTAGGKEVAAFQKQALSTPNKSDSQANWEAKGRHFPKDHWRNCFLCELHYTLWEDGQGCHGMLGYR